MVNCFMNCVLAIKKNCKLIQSDSRDKKKKFQTNAALLNFQLIKEA